MRLYFLVCPGKVLAISTTSVAIYCSQIADQSALDDIDLLLGRLVHNVGNQVRPVWSVPS